MFGIGTSELVVILIIILVLFGGSKLPELAKSLGQAIKEIRKGMKEESTDNTDNKEKKSKKTEDTK